MMDKIIKKIEGSEKWEMLNKKVKELYESHSKTPSEEEYQALRNMMIYKVMMEDKEIMNLMAEECYKEFNKGA